VLVGVVIGSGIFRVPSVVAAEVGTTGGALLVWVAGALITLAGALSMAELSVAFPRPGGVYVFLREAYGPLVAFLFGWIKLFVTGPSALAAVALVFAAYAGAFLPLNQGEQRLVAAALLMGLTWLNIRSVALSARIQNLSTGAKVVGLAALAGLILAFGDPGSGTLNGPVVWQPASWGGFGVALIAVLWTYTGWVDLTYLAGEVKDPAKSFPRAMAGGMAVVVLLYLLVNVAFFQVLSLREIAESEVVASAAAERVFGPAGGALVAGLVMLSAFGSLNGTILSNPRVFFSMADDGLFFRSVAAVHPRHQTPHVALLVYGALGLVGVWTRTFEQLAQIFVVGIWPFYALAVGAVFVLRRRRAGTRSSFRAWGYPVLPAGFLLVSGAMLISVALHRPAEVALSLGVLALGIPAYYGWLALPAARRRPRGGGA
jgi:amino acid transporter